MSFKNAARKTSRGGGKQSPCGLGLKFGSQNCEGYRGLPRKISRVFAFYNIKTPYCGN